MPALGGAAFRPKSIIKKNPITNKNEIDLSSDDLPVLDDATRKMIMEDIQRGKMPTTTPTISGTGVQGASYLLQSKQTTAALNKENNNDDNDNNNAPIPGEDFTSMFLRQSWV